MKKIAFILIVSLLFINFNIQADVRLPSVLNDNMVLQRDIPINIWGWANPGEKVTVQYNGQKISGNANSDGKWIVQLNMMKAGGPYEMHINGKNEIVLKNILIGDIWVCSGQSNMEFQLNKSNDAANEIVLANYPSIRLYTIKRRMSEKPLDDINNSKWEICSPATAAEFSAVGYYFGKDLLAHLNVPIGLINTNWGGTNVEAWTSMETMYNLKEYIPELEKLKTMSFSTQNLDIDKSLEIWNKRVELEDSGSIQKWQLPETNFSNWKEMQLPQYWETKYLPNLDGVVWFKKDFDLSTQDIQNSINLNLGKIDDADQTYVNGNLVGETNNYSAFRNYSVPVKFLKPGKNIIVVRVKDYGWGGGFYSKPDELFLEEGGLKESLAGNWKYKVGIDLPSPNLTTNPNQFPSSLYNAMIHPLTNFGIKGVIWYQGETNTKEAYKYRTLLSNMIIDWRKSWKQGNSPFLIVQLANFNSEGTSDDGDWPLLRESQYVVTTKVSNTGLAVTIDIGDADDIHPRDKKDVGYRLSLSALKIAYGENLVYSGPTYKSMKVENGKVIIEFDNIGSGLLAKNKYGYINAFAVAGSDKIYHWAKVYLDGNKVVVYSDDVKNPLSVRYAWANNPDDVNLFNKEMLPAVPFRTDQW